MKKSTVLVALAGMAVLGQATEATGADSSTDFQIGQTSFPKGDWIEITSVERTPDRLVVKGHYKLVSSDTAQLALYTTTREAISVPTDPQQLMTITNGTGDFELVHPQLVPGLNHVSMYSLTDGQGFAGVYFGTKEEAAEESKLDLGYNRENPVSISGPNEALLEYLGNPVPPPANLDARYTKAGLIAAAQLAAQNAGISVKKVSIEDSEFPFLVGVVCAGADFQKLKDRLIKMDGYSYGGSIGNDVNSDGSDTCNVFNLVSHEAYPPGTSQQIFHRLWLRQQVFFYHLSMH